MASSVIKSVASKTPSISRLLTKNFLLPRFNHFSSKSSSSQGVKPANLTPKHPNHITDLEITNPDMVHIITPSSVFTSPPNPNKEGKRFGYREYFVDPRSVTLILTEDLVQLPSKHDETSLKVEMEKLEQRILIKMGKMEEKMEHSMAKMGDRILIKMAKMEDRILINMAKMEDRILIKMAKIEYGILIKMAKMEDGILIKKAEMEDRILIKMAEMKHGILIKMAKMEDGILIKMRELEETVVFKVSEKLEVSMKENQRKLEDSMKENRREMLESAEMLKTVKEAIADLGQQARKVFSEFDPIPFKGNCRNSTTTSVAVPVTTKIRE